MEPLTKVTICKHLQKTRENYCYSCNLYFCNECFISHIYLTRHISGNKQDIQRIIQNEQQIVTQNDDKLEEYALFVEVHKAKVSQREESKSYIDKFTKSESEEINSRKLGVITRESTKEGKRLQKELKHIDREYKRFLHDLEQRVVDDQGMFAIRVIDEKKFQFYTPEGSQEPKITELQRETLLNQLELLESKLVPEKGNITSNTDQIFKVIFALFGLILTILSITLIIYSYEGDKTLKIYESQKIKQKERSSLYHSRVYEANILEGNITLFIKQKNYKLNYLVTLSSNNTVKRKKLTLKKKEIILRKENIATIPANIETLKNNKSLTCKKYLEILQIENNTAQTNKFSFDLLVNLWVILMNYTPTVTKYSQEDLIKYSELIRYWTAYNHIGGTFIIVSGPGLHGISIIWYETKLVIEHINLPTQLTYFDQLIQLIQNGDVLVTNLFVSSLYYVNMSNCLIIHSKELFETIWLFDYDLVNPNTIEIFTTEDNNSHFMHYDYKTSLFTKNITLKHSSWISVVLKPRQLPKFILAFLNKIRGYSIETGLKLQEYSTLLNEWTTSLIELPNNQLGYISHTSLNILDLDTLTFIEKFELNTGDHIFIKLFSLTPDGNILLARKNGEQDYLIFNFDTRTILWEGKLQTYFVKITAAIQVIDNIFIYSDSKSKLWVIDIDNNLHLPFIDIRQYEENEFNFSPTFINAFINIISVVERGRSAAYTINQI